MAIHTDHKNIIDLVMGDLTQFHIPIYQRLYTWDSNNQVQKLLDDILNFGEEYKDNKRAEYYIGNVIVKNQTRGMVTERVVIDGQQRITTSILILCAIRDIYRNKIKSEEGKRSADSIQKHLYTQDDAETKLKLNNMEHQQALTNLLSGMLQGTSADDKKTRYFKNYDYIHKYLSNMDESNFNGFLDLLRRVKVVIIFLDEDQDENSVFESINSLGKPLAGSDLIKNYLFTFKKYECSHHEENQLINLYTRTFEAQFKTEEYMEQALENFFRDYIATQKQWLVKKDPKVVYYEFKGVIGEIPSIERLKEIIVDLAKWALIYQVVKVKNHPDIDLNYIGYLRGSFGQYSVLMMNILNNYSHVESNELIIDDPIAFNNALKAIVAYEASRFLAGYPSGEVVRFSPMVFKRLDSPEFDSNMGYGDRFLAFVASAEEGYRLPSSKELKDSVVTGNLYTRKSQHLKRFLTLIENMGKKECLNYEEDMKKAQIEHILPQNPVPTQWSSISHDDKEKYLHTLGNLTLTFDNQTLSNKPFSEKKIILAEKSRINLNAELLKYNEFNVETIKTRAGDMLARFEKEFFNR
ncbi:DUF262 domain-containing HNH endonuclease family protein [Iodobacter sp. LRB]|uniref:DUF262 domain-containing protein n=1 Tax=unclassified Iodobacter TaxID=235634 RepID=UPI000C123259|nr:DUF262 domain-containing protein [Iodobacter sp. BJB302]